MIPTFTPVQIVANTFRDASLSDFRVFSFTLEASGCRATERITFNLFGAEQGSAPNIATVRLLRLHQYTHVNHRAYELSVVR